MSETSPPSVSFVALTERAHVTRLLALGLRGPRRPVDRLIARLEAPDGSRWLDQTVERLDSGSESPVRMLLTRAQPGGQRGLEMLIALKDRCKKAASGSAPGEEPLEPMLGYFLAIGAALAHQGKLISSMPRRDVDGVLLDLACAMPEPWVELLCRATLVA